jgi:protein gp37
MAKETQIQWTDATWNIARGCTKVDEDCKYCYMYRDSMGGTRYDALHVVRTKTVFDMPLRYKETKSKVWDGNPLIFTSSLTDFFHEDIDEYRAEAWDIIRQCKHLTFQILTKRPERIAANVPDDWGYGWDNVWLGTSVGSQQSVKRMEDLAVLETNCIKFLSLEPLHGEIDLNYKNVPIIHPDNEGFGVEIIKAFDWVIVGGESGNDNGKYKYRPCELAWLDNIVEDCKEVGVPVFVKQLGTHLAKQFGLSDRHGGNIEEFPENLKVRQFPKVKA